MKFREYMGASLLSIAMACATVSGAQAQSITEALTAAYQHAPQLQDALLAAKSSAENIVQAKSRKLPTIGASVGGTQTFGLSNGNWSTGSSLTTGLSYSQTIFDNFQTEAQIEAARASAELAEYQIRNTEQNVLLQVIQAYMAVHSGTQLVALREENARFFEAQLKSARDRLEVGEGTRIDVAQAEARLAQGQAGYRAAVNSLETSRATFQRFVGMRPQALNTAHGYGNLIPRSLEAAISEAEVGHPAILMSKAGIRAAQAGSDAAQAAGGPTATINGQLGTTWSSAGPAPVGRDGISGQVGFQITVPIYAGGAIGSSVRKANIEQIRSEVTAMSTYDQVREAVISAWSALQSADAQITAAQAAVAASNTVVEGVIQERDLGTRTTLDVLNAQADLTSARESVINASSNKVVATFALLSAMGRLTASDLGLPVAIKTAVPYTQTVEDVWQELRTVAD